ncbi:hypothetical protein PAAG_01153 [Paracoccidioides lutzii Pb01]|uniref:Chitin synthesis regulation, Congo red resistance, RCR protein n=1 Tax=Paracoccidioides lutzii (strain ATCC MYA-826 / Pb01) TaxID=502779 RepID=C1GRK8_PARBA|nr:hypothetical protein PAAG_01153 [Paracoccidioides lutzii Pb01]EEH38232.2 hypothetical protein PAAG_01153 [Paracoccidioides lutzii Pb01]
MAILRRNYCYTEFGTGRVFCRSPWSYWGRWVALVIIIMSTFFIFLAFACISSRRRRRRGQQPFHGTGWAAQPPFWQQGRQQNQYQYPSAPPPQYTQGNYYAQKPSSFGGQQYPPQEQGVELQPPQNVYRAGEQVYQPPVGPPTMNK